MWHIKSHSDIVFSTSHNISNTYEKLQHTVWYFSQKIAKYSLRTFKIFCFQQYFWPQHFISDLSNSFLISHNLFQQYFWPQHFISILSMSFQISCNLFSAISFHMSCNLLKLLKSVRNSVWSILCNLLKFFFTKFLHKYLDNIFI